MLFRSATYYPQVATAPDPTAALLSAVVARSGQLAASWMAAGFVHGVLNTDNMNITGESFDYGPYRFLPRNDPNFVAAYFDAQGLYSFGRQPEAVFWNLQNLGGCLSMISEQEPLVEALNGFADAYRGSLAAAILARLGLKSRGRELDAGLVNAAFTALAAGGERVRWEPFFFDWFCGDVGRAMASPRGDLYAGQAFADFRRRVAETEPERPGRLLDPYFARSEPEELLIEEIEAIWDAIAAEDDWSAFNAKLGALEQARKAWGLSPA